MACDPIRTQTVALGTAVSTGILTCGMVQTLVVARVSRPFGGSLAFRFGGPRAAPIYMREGDRIQLPKACREVYYDVTPDTTVQGSPTADILLSPEPFEYDSARWQLRGLDDPVSGQADADTTAGGALLVAAREGRAAVTLYNRGTAAVYVGPSGVTTGTGFQLDAGESITIKTRGAVYGIVAAGSEAVHYLEH